MIQDPELENIRAAIDQEDLAALVAAIAPYSDDESTEGLLFPDQAIFMYACQHATPDIVRVFLDKGVYVMS